MAREIDFNSTKFNINELDMISLSVNAQRGGANYYLSVFTGNEGKINVSDAVNYDKVIGFLKIVDKKLKMAGQNNFVYLDRCIVNIDKVKKFNFVPADTVGRSCVSVKFTDDKYAFVYDGFDEKYASSLAERYKAKALGYKMGNLTNSNGEGCIQIDLESEEMS